MDVAGISGNFDADGKYKCILVSKTSCLISEAMSFRSQQRRALKKRSFSLRPPPPFSSLRSAEEFLYPRV